VIEVKHLRKKYGDHVAIDDLSFDIEPGKVYGFLGPNGAGKSTTMNIMTGYLGATSGEVKINGYDIIKQPEKAKQQIGYLPEIPPLYMEMKVEEYLQFAAELKKIPKQELEVAVEEVMERTKLLEVRGRLIRNLSKGYKQRVGFAQALLGFPEILILDEPTVGLDPQQIIEVRELIRSLAKEHTVLLSSHILAEIREVCDYILILSHGKLVASDTPENLESLMQGTREIELEIRATEEPVQEVLEKVPDVEIIEVNTKREDVVNVKLSASAEEDVRDQIFFACADARLPILMMKQHQVSLEDIFLELTQTDDEEDTNDSDL
jgi:ABC-2 type transport system ATP-binding protein